MVGVHKGSSQQKQSGSSRLERVTRVQSNSFKHLSRRPAPRVPSSDTSAVPPRTQQRCHPESQTCFCAAKEALRLWC